MSHMYLYLDGQLLHQLTGKYHIFSVLFAQLVQDLFHFRSFHCISYYFTIRICWFSWKKTDIKHWQSWKIAAHFNFGQLFWNTYGWTSLDLNMKQPMDHVPTFPSCSPHFGSPFHQKWAFSRCVVARATRTIKIWRERIKWQSSLGSVSCGPMGFDDLVILGPRHPPPQIARLFQDEFVDMLASDGFSWHMFFGLFVDAGIAACLNLGMMEVIVGT